MIYYVLVGMCGMLLAGYFVLIGHHFWDFGICIKHFMICRDNTATMRRSFGFPFLAVAIPLFGVFPGVTSKNLFCLSG
jgi:hypothetical protein